MHLFKCMLIDALINDINDGIVKYKKKCKKTFLKKSITV